MGFGKKMKMKYYTSKGGALVLSLLIILALTLIGIVSVRNAQQENTGSGNYKNTKQAYYVAELGINHVITLLQQQGDYLLGQRLDNEYFEVDSNGKLQFYQHTPINKINLPTKQINLSSSPFLNQGPKPLGSLGLVPSYKVRVEGFTPAPPPSGQELSMDGSGTRPKFCLIEFTAQGFIAPTALPEMPKTGVITDINYRTNVEQVIEQRVKAAVILGPFLSNICQI